MSFSNCQNPRSMNKNQNATWRDKPGNKYILSSPGNQQVCSDNRRFALFQKNGPRIGWRLQSTITSRVDERSGGGGGVKGEKLQYGCGIWSRKVSCLSRNTIRASLRFGNCCTRAQIQGLLYCNTLVSQYSITSQSPRTVAEISLDRQSVKTYPGHCT